MGHPLSRSGSRDLSTAVLLRAREAQPSLKTTELEDRASHFGWNAV